MNDKQHDPTTTVAVAINMVARRGFAADDTAERLLYALTGKGFDYIDAKDARRLVNKLRHAANTLTTLIEGLQVAFQESVEEAAQKKKAAAEPSDYAEFMPDPEFKGLIGSLLDRKDQRSLKPNSPTSLNRRSTRR
jgi:hypothetical protein